MKYRVTVDFNDKDWIAAIYIRRKIAIQRDREIRDIDMMALWLVEANIPHKVRRQYHYTYTWRWGEGTWEKTVVAGNFLVVKAFFYFDDEADALHFVLSNGNPGDFTLDLRS